MSEPATEGQAAPDDRRDEVAATTSAEQNPKPQPGTDPENTAPRKRRRRGSRGGRNRNRNRTGDGVAGNAADDGGEELPDRPIEGRPQSVEAAERALVRKPQIGDTRPAPAAEDAQPKQQAKGGDRSAGNQGQSQSPSA